MDHRDELVSVIVPVYNVEKYLREAIDSVCKQTYPNWELLLVDDGSKDQSGIICDEYAQKDVRIRVFHTKNKGVSSARNLGIENANGKWIAFMDSDDYLDANYLEVLIRHSENMEMVVCSTQNVPTGRCTILTDQIAYYSTLDDTRKELDRFRTYFYSAVWNKIYLRDKVKMRFNPNLSLGEDWWFNVEYMQNCHGICVLPDVLDYHRVSTENSLTKQFRINAIEDSSIIYHAQLRLYGDSQTARYYVNRDFSREMIKQSVKLTRNKQCSLKEKKKILDRWANHDFWKEDTLDFSTVLNRRHRIYMNLLKHKRTWLALMCCEMFVVILNLKVGNTQENEFEHVINNG